MAFVFSTIRPRKQKLFSIASWKFLGLVGLLLCGWSLGRSKGLIGCGVIGATWTVIHEYGIHIGPDAWTFGLSWLSIGLCWYAMQQRNLCGVLFVLWLVRSS